MTILLGKTLNMLTLNQDAEVWASEGRVGVVNDDDLAVWVEQEQCRFWEWLVRLTDVARLGHKQAPPAHMCPHMPSINLGCAASSNPSAHWCLNFSAGAHSCSGGCTG